MKRLYKIIVFFLIIFGIGIYFTIRSINSSLKDEENTEVVSVPKLLNYTSSI